MNSIIKISSLPITHGPAMNYPKTVILSRGLGCVHIPSSTRIPPLLGQRNSLKDSEQIIQITSPVNLKEAMCTDKFFAEKRGNEIIAFAATKKLLSEEKLRRTLNSFNVPLNNIIRENRRWKPSAVHPICPVIHEEL